MQIIFKYTLGDVEPTLHHVASQEKSFRHPSNWGERERERERERIGASDLGSYAALVNETFFFHQVSDHVYCLKSKQLFQNFNTCWSYKIWAGSKSKEDMDHRGKKSLSL